MATTVCLLGPKSLLWGPIMATRKKAASRKKPAPRLKNERLAELELRFTEQQHQLEELSSVVYAQQRQLDAMLAHVRIMEKKLEAEPGLVEARGDEKPPHY